MKMAYTIQEKLVRMADRKGLTGERRARLLGSKTSSIFDHSVGPESHIQYTANGPKNVTEYLRSRGVMKKSAGELFFKMAAKVKKEELNSYVLSPGELTTNRELDPEEEKQIKFNRKGNWSFFDPYSFTRASLKKDPKALIQNPYYRSSLSTTQNVLGAGAMGTGLGASLRLMGVPTKWSVGIGALGGAAHAISALASYKNKVDLQKVRNSMIEDYIRSRPEGTMADYNKIQTAMTTKRTTPGKFKKANEHKTYLAGDVSFDVDSWRKDWDARRAAAAAASHREDNIINKLRGGYGTLITGINLGQGIAGYWQNKAQLEDLRQRYHAKKKQKEDADIFHQKFTEKKLKELQRGEEFDYLQEKKSEESGCFLLLTGLSSLFCEPE